MPTYLTTAFRDRDAVKGLGARWDPLRKRWFVPDGRDLAPFARWLPATPTPTEPVPGTAPVERDTPRPTLPGSALPAKGVPLSMLLAGVAQAVAQAYRVGAWTLVEVSRVDARRGHVYLELAERDAAGQAVAQARAIVWAETAAILLPAFERATGAVLGPGLKLLVRARPTLHPLYGLSLVVDDIDPDYTLGDLEARKREIRTRLQAEGLFDRNRRLPAPWDYRAVLVVAPEGAAGLGDFRAEADRLQRTGACRFVYMHSRFQGDGAAAEVRDALTRGLQAWKIDHDATPDAVCVIRGGGAVNDLAWLNDYALARWICECPVPVHTGIGHERDETVLDEVAHTRFDTPSKVIAGIEAVMRRRTTEARSLCDTVRREAARLLHEARRRTQGQAEAVRHGAHRRLRQASEHADALVHEVRHRAGGGIATARRALPLHLAQVRAEARRVLATADSAARTRRDAIARQARDDLRHLHEATTRDIAAIGRDARRAVAQARNTGDALVREITGQGPERTLARGFAIVRAGGDPVTDALTLRAVPAGTPVEIQFHDGPVPVDPHRSPR